MFNDIKVINTDKFSDHRGYLWTVWEKKIFKMQYKGIIKYLEPRAYLIDNVYLMILKLINLGDFNWQDFVHWVKMTNPIWLKHISKKGFYHWQLKKTSKAIVKVIAQKSQLGVYINKMVKVRRAKNTL